MDQIEIILRTTDPSGKVTEQILAKFDTEEPAIGSDKVLQYSGLCIDPVQHQISYQGKVLPLRHLFISPISQEEFSRKSRSTRLSGRKNRWR